MAEDKRHQEIVKQEALKALRRGAKSVTISGIQNPDLTTWISNRRDKRIVLNPKQEVDILTKG